MFENLKMLFKIRTWFKSKTLSLAGVLGVLAGIDLATPTDIVQWVVDALVGLGFMQGTAIAILLAVKSVADVILRVKTDKPLTMRAHD